MCWSTPQIQRVATAPSVQRIFSESVEQYGNDWTINLKAITASIKLLQTLFLATNYTKSSFVYTEGKMVPLEVNN